LIVRQLVAALCLGIVLAIAGCGGESDDTTTGDAGSNAGTESGARPDEVSSAARERGLKAEGEEEAGGPIVTLEDVSYEWRHTPYTGLQAYLTFGNANEVFERARAYVFVVASYSGRPETSARGYPLDAEFSDGMPTDYRDGAHILYRKDQDVNCMIRYEGGDGYFDRLRVIVYSEEGELLINQSYTLDVNGEPAGRKKIRPILDL